MNKFGVLDNDDERIFEYPDIWCIQEYPNLTRGVVAPSNNQMELMLDMIKEFPPPYWVLYILVVSRVGQKPGRYQIPKPLSFDELENFCLEYKDFFESDGRHHLWIASAESGQMLIYDRHNIIYIYDNPDNIREYFDNSNFQEKEVEFPMPHIHFYNEENDRLELDLLNHFDWIYSELKEQDEV